MAEQKKMDIPFFLSEKEVIQWTAHWHYDRRILIGGELNEETLKKASLELMKLDFEKTAPITLMIQSDGGKVVPTHQIEDTISMLNSEVNGIVIGDAASMAVDLLQMCKRRSMLPSARILVHYIRNTQLWICDDMDQLETDIQYFREKLREMGERRLRLYEMRTGLSREKLKELFRQGEVHKVYFSAKQAIKLGLADDIVTDFKFFPAKNEK